MKKLCRICKTFLRKVMEEMEKDVHIWYVI
jgi:hypothetical protein